MAKCNHQWVLLHIQRKDGHIYKFWYCGVCGVDRMTID